MSQCLPKQHKRSLPKWSIKCFSPLNCTLSTSMSTGLRHTAAFVGTLTPPTDEQQISLKTNCRMWISQTNQDPLSCGSYTLPVWCVSMKLWRVCLFSSVLLVTGFHDSKHDFSRNSKDKLLTNPPVDCEVSRKRSMEAI